MFIEAQTAPPQDRIKLHSGDLQQSIFESYNPRNDATRLQELTHLTPIEQEYYIKENVMAYLEEFAGEIPLKQLAGILRPDGSLEMCGANVTNMYRYSAQLAGPNSREAAEAQGMDAILEGINNGANRAVWISPPKMADYGFAFTFVADSFNQELGGIPIREFLPRYNEELNSIETSREIYRSVQTAAGISNIHPDNLHSYEDFLRNPIFSYTQNHEDLQFIYDRVGISTGDIAYSEQFRKEVLPQIEPWLREYTKVVRELREHDHFENSKKTIQLEEKAQLLIGAMFNTARVVRRLLIEDHSIISHEKDISMMKLTGNQWADERELLAAAYVLAKHEPLVISGGSNCPVTQIASSESSVIANMRSGFDFVSSMQSFGLEANQGCGFQGCPINKIHFHCPGEKNGRKCNHAISGTNECSECGLTSKAWAEKTGQQECT